MGEPGVPAEAEGAVAQDLVAADGGVGLTAVLKHRPDVVADGQPDAEMDGLEATRRILAEQPGTDCPIIMLTTFDPHL
jgi:CheY-like chemotaxis protein